MTVQPVVPRSPQIYNPLEAQLAQEMGYTGVFGSPSAADTMIYLGSDYDDFAGNQGVPTYLRKPGASTGMVTTDQANAEWVRLDPQQAKRFDDAIEQYTGKRPEGSNGLYWWQQMVKQSGAFSSALGRPVSVFETAEMLAARSPAGPSGGGAGGPSTTVYKDEQVNLSDPSTARSILDTTIGRYLGRSPNQKEYKSFLQALNAMEEATPAVSERVTRSSGGTNQTVTSKGKSTTGLSREQFATEYAKSEEDYAETQLSTTGLQAFLGMLK